MAQRVIWVIDTSSIAEIRRSIENVRKRQVFEQMTILVEEGRLCYPKQVVGELERFADPKLPDDQYKWAKQNQAKASENPPSLEDVKLTLLMVPDVLDPDKDTGTEEADPYVLAMAIRFQNESKDARVVTEEKNDFPKKLSLRTAAGLLGLPSVPLKAFLSFEKII